MELTPELRLALRNFLHPLAPNTMEERALFLEAGRRTGADEASLWAGQLTASLAEASFDAGLQVVRIIFGETVSQEVREEAIARQRWLKAND